MNTQEQLPTTFEKPTADYLRVMTASPEVAIADAPANAQAILDVYAQAKDQQAELLVLPELGITGYSAADLFHNDHVLEQTIDSLQLLARETTDGPAMIVGAPLRHKNVLYNCGVMLAEGKIAGIVPKTHLPNYGEFYEMRWFNSGKDVVDQTMQIGNQDVPFGTDVLFQVNDTTIGVEICEDAWAPIPPSTHAALNGAEVIVNLSASNELIGKVNYRRQLVAGLAGRLVAGYVYTSAGKGESNADVVYGGHQMINELGRKEAERLPFDAKTKTLTFDMDRAYIAHDRAANKTFAGQAVEAQADMNYRLVAVMAAQPTDDTVIRYVDPYPFVPSNPETLNQRCEEILNDLSQAFAQRIHEIGSQGIVLGLSGGLDSTLALIIATETAQLLGKGNDFIHTITMPGPASSNMTQDNATLLATAMNTTHKIIPISQLTDQLLTAIGHDGVTENVTFENTQARARTTLLMNYANLVGGILQGTGDMSEIMQGYCTYNADHMSMFNPNSDVPKTLVRHLVQWYANNRADSTTKALLEAIIDTPVSAELIGNGELTQTTDSIIGPDDLRDFYTYQHLRHGTRPQKIGYLATQAFAEKYTPETVAKWLHSFMKLHTASQWKREAQPGGTQIATVAGSPRSTLRMAPNTSPDWWK